MTTRNNLLVKAAEKRFLKMSIYILRNSFFNYSSLLIYISIDLF